MLDKISRIITTRLQENNRTVRCHRVKEKPNNTQPLFTQLITSVPSLLVCTVVVRDIHAALPTANLTRNRAFGVD